MTRWLGRWIIAVGIIHVTFGFVVFAEPLLGILQDGLWNSVDGHSGRPLAFWFVFVGLLTIVFGALLDWTEGRGLSAPRFVGWAFFLLVVLAIVTMPIGGGWLLLPVGLGMVMRSYRPRTNTGPDVSG